MVLTVRTKLLSLLIKYSFTHATVVPCSGTGSVIKIADFRWCKSIPVAVRSYGADLRPLSCWDCGVWFPPEASISVTCVACCQPEVSASGLSLIQRSPTECDREASIMRRTWSTRGCCAMVRDYAIIHNHHGINQYAICNGCQLFL